MAGLGLGLAVVAWAWWSGLFSPTAGTPGASDQPPAEQDPSVIARAPRDEEPAIRTALGESTSAAHPALSETDDGLTSTHGRVRVTSTSGAPIEGAEVQVSWHAVGLTDETGTLEFELPSELPCAIEVQAFGWTDGHVPDAFDAETSGSENPNSLTIELSRLLVSGVARVGDTEPPRGGLGIWTVTMLPELQMPRSQDARLWLGRHQEWLEERAAPYHPRWTFATATPPWPVERTTTIRLAPNTPPLEIIERFVPVDQWQCSDLALIDSTVPEGTLAVTFSFPPGADPSLLRHSYWGLQHIDEPMFQYGAPSDAFTGDEPTVRLQVPAGRYELGSLAEFSPAPFSSRPVTVEPGGVTYEHVTLDLLPSRVTVRLTNALTGEPIPLDEATLLIATPDAPGATMIDLSDAIGQVGLSLAPGAPTAWVMAPAGVSSRQRKVLEPGTAAEWTFELTPIRPDAETGEWEVEIGGGEGEVGDGG